MNGLQDLSPRAKRGVPTLLLVAIGLLFVIVYQMTVQWVPAGTPGANPWFLLGRDLLGITGSVLLLWTIIRATVRMLRR
jgi:hypothetical protein